MPKAYYTCHLLPLGLLTACGFTPCWLGNRLPDPSVPARRDALSVHPTTCPYVTRLVAAADALLNDSAAGQGSLHETCGQDVVVIPGGCDAMRRLGDLLAATSRDRVFVLSLPRASAERDVRDLAAEFARLEAWLHNRGTSTLPDLVAAASTPTTDCRSWTPNGPPFAIPFDYPAPPEPGGVFVVSGPLSDDSLLRLLDDLGAKVSGLESCTSPDRSRPLSPQASDAAETAPLVPDAKGDTRSGGGGASSPEGLTHRHLDLARQVLSLGKCPRFSTKERRDHLTRRLEETRPSSLIYARQSFCDPGAYDALLVAELARERGLPFLEIEVGFPLEASGPLRTRVEAFLEAQLLDEDLLDLDFEGE